MRPATPRITLTERETIDAEYLRAVIYERACRDAAKAAPTNSLAYDWRLIAEHWSHEADRLMGEGLR